MVSSLSAFGFSRHARFIRSAVVIALTFAGSACGSDSKTIEASFVAPSYGDPCPNFSCNGVGKCVSTAQAPAPTCDCQTGYAGAHCELCDIGFHRDATDRCAPDRSCAAQSTDPCAPHGSCDDKTGVIACDCDPGYDGPRCTLCAGGYASDADGNCLQEVISNGQTLALAPSCGPSSCNSRGLCSASKGALSCDCYPGYIGAHCESCANGYERPAGSDRCVAMTTCAASSCGGCATFDGDEDFPPHPDTCVSADQLDTDTMTLWSDTDGSQMWLCAASTRYGFSSEHVALQASMATPAEITFKQAITDVSLDYAAWDDQSIEVLGDGIRFKNFTLKRYEKGSLSLSFDPPVWVLGFRSADMNSHTIAIDNIVFESMCQ